MPIKSIVSSVTPDHVVPGPADEIQFLIEAPNAAFVDTKQASVLLGVAPETLEVWRSTRRVQIPHYKLGRSVRYMLGDLRAYLSECRKGVECE